MDLQKCPHNDDIQLESHSSNIKHTLTVYAPHLYYSSPSGPCRTVGCEPSSSSSKHTLTVRITCFPKSMLSLNECARPHKRTPHRQAYECTTHATPTEEARLAFCCYCNSVIPRCRRPNGGQGVGFCCVFTLCCWLLAYPSLTQVNVFFACLSTLHLISHCPPTTSGHHGCPLAAKLPSWIHYCEG